MAGRPRPFVAMWPGYCYECDELVKPGDRAAYARSARRRKPRLVHAACAGIGPDWGVA